jgi:hypothetical protein
MSLSRATIVGDNGKYAVSIPVFFRWANSVCFRFDVPLDDMLAAVAVWRAMLPQKPARIGDGPVQDE